MLDIILQPDGFDIGYEGEFAHVLGKYNLLVGGRLTSPNFAVNFFGFGNDSQNPEDEIDRDFNRVRFESLNAKVGMRQSTKYGTTLTHLLTVESIEVERTNGRFLDLNWR